MRMQTTWGAKTIDRAVESPSTIRIGASDMEMDGFIDDTFSEYRQRSVVRTVAGRVTLIHRPGLRTSISRVRDLRLRQLRRGEDVDRRSGAWHGRRRRKQPARASLHAHRAL